MLGLILLALLAQDPDPKVEAAAQLQAMDTAQVAEMLVPSLAATITDHSALPSRYFGPPLSPELTGPLAQVELYTLPEFAAEGLCRRVAYTAQIVRTRDGTGFMAIDHHLVPYPQVRLDADCEQAGDRTFAFLAGKPIEQVADVLRRLDSLQSAIRSGLAVAVLIECESAIRGQPCPADTADLFARLPLGQVSYIGQDAEGRIELIISDHRLGDPYWSLTLIDGEQPRIMMRRAAPAPP